MGFRFYKRIKIAPGISMNFSKSGPSFSFGPRGMKYTVGQKGIRQTFGIPGTGLYYTTSKSWGGKNAPAQSTQVQAVPQVSFMKSLFMSPEEKAFLNGINGFVTGQYDRAYSYFQQNTDDPDSAFMCGFIALGKGSYAEAEKYFLNCLAKVNELGKTMSKAKSDFELILDITDYIEAPINLDSRGLILALAEACQGQGKYQAALNAMDKLWDENVSDKVVCLSLMDLVTRWPGSPSQFFKDIVEMTSSMENDEPIDTNILYLRGYSLYRLGLYDAAAKQLSDILRKTKDRPEALLLKIRYMRGRIYEERGYAQKARSDYEKIYASHPDFGDVKERLGL